MKNIVVFCGSSIGTDEVFASTASALGEMFAQRGIGLVYGGAKVGIMGAVAEAVLRNGGRVTGVIPYFLRTKEVAHEGLTQLIQTDSMHERKTKMNELCDGVIALPGGFGTMEELFEMLTWAQLGLHQKPIGLLNVAGFYDDLIGMIGKMVSKGFLKQAYRDMLLVDTDVSALLDKMETYNPPDVEKWITPATS